MMEYLFRDLQALYRKIQFYLITL